MQIGNSPDGVEAAKAALVRGLARKAQPYRFPSDVKDFDVVFLPFAKSWWWDT